VKFIELTGLISTQVDKEKPLRGRVWRTGPGDNVDPEGFDLCYLAPGVDMQLVAIGPVVADMLHQTLQIRADIEKNVVLFGESAAGLAAQQEHEQFW
jgi:hypothetical protein